MLWTKDLSRAVVNWGWRQKRLWQLPKSSIQLDWSLTQGPVSISLCFLSLFNECGISCIWDCDHLQDWDEHFPQGTTAATSCGGPTRGQQVWSRSSVKTSNTVDSWGGFAGQVLANGGPRPRAGKKSDQAHPPIHPLKAAHNLQVILDKFSYYND